MSDKSAVIQRICEALLENRREDAQCIARTEYPFEGQESAVRRYTAFQCTQIFVRDGFTDRYSGQRLIFPGTLRLLSKLLPEEFPAHPNWKMTQSHLVYYELFPTIDHVIPIARGGKDDQSNWVTTSMLRNSAKSNWTLEELGWQLVPAGCIEEWDGLMHMFLAFVEGDLTLLKDNYLKRWSSAALRVSGIKLD